MSAASTWVGCVSCKDMTCLLCCHRAHFSQQTSAQKGGGSARKQGDGPHEISFSSCSISQLLLPRTDLSPELLRKALSWDKG